MGDSVSGGSGAGDMDGSGGLGDGSEFTNKMPGGILNQRHTAKRVQKMKWTAENDRTLLLYGLGREISTREYAIIAAEFPEQPTPKSIQERLTKLRAEQLKKLSKVNFTEPTAPLNLLPGDDSGPDDSMDDVAASPAPAKRDSYVPDDTAAATTPAKPRAGKAPSTPAAVQPFQFGTSFMFPGDPATAAQAKEAEDQAAAEALVALSSGGEKKRKRGKKAEKKKEGGRSRCRPLRPNSLTA
ncbi:hypothetical protein LTR36_009324 [Oleoguttula mirabilis]|uniref:Myb-like domain-containing protein n=1 Tax=Oleoguttula mirabilis TaxID=1507867 RepID=A0AAV9JSC1_9PEZI|nr:hypothetical protein LTR36_009324 [Oleoguttula mirabilis]